MKIAFQYQSRKIYSLVMKTNSAAKAKAIVLGFCFMFFFHYSAIAQTSNSGIAGSEGNNNKLWYLEPAANWMEALPIGNGKLGAMVFGGRSTNS